MNFKNKKNVTITISILLTVGIVFAMWSFGNITGFSVYKVDSSKPNMTITRQLSGALIDTSDNNQSFIDTFDVYSNKNTQGFINYEFVKTLIDPDCSNWSADCTSKVFWNGDGSFGYGFTEPLSSGDNIFMKKGNNQVIVRTECLQYSCPQNISLVMTIIPKK